MRSYTQSLNTLFSSGSAHTHTHTNTHTNPTFYLSGMLPLLKMTLVKSPGISCSLQIIMSLKQNKLNPGYHNPNQLYSFTHNLNKKNVYTDTNFHQQIKKGG